MNLKYSFPMLALFVASLASANGEIFEQLDSNQDTFVSQEEAAQLPILAEVWDELDADQDGLLSQTEFMNLEISGMPEDTENTEVAE